MRGERSIPFLDLARLHASIRPELDRVIDETIRSSSFIGGATPSFEDAFASMLGVAGTAGCASGTDALALALSALGIGPGDEVVVPAMTFVATAEAVAMTGASPVLADVDPSTLLLTAGAVDAVRTPSTRAVVPVHLYGRMVDPADLSAMRAAGLVVVEDAAQAHLARRGGHGVGTLSHAATFSFHPAKNLGALGDAGAVVSQDARVIERVKLARDHGRSSRYRHDCLGRCSRLDGLQAAVLRAKLRHLPEWTERRRAHAVRYRDRLGDLVVPFDDGAVHHLLVIRPSGRRAIVERGLLAAGIGCGIHYPFALSQQPSLRRWWRPCPAAERAASSVLSLPIDPLMADNDIDHVCEAVERTLAVVAVAKAR